MIDFDTLTYADAQKIIASKENESFDKTLKFYDGDHWQASDGWIGPKPDDASIRNMIENEFVFHNAVKEVVDNHVSGLVSNGVHWWSDDESIQTLLTDWLNLRNLPDVFRQFIGTLAMTGKGAIRVFLPPAFVQDGEVSTFGSVEDALKHVHVHALTHHQSCQYIHPETLVELQLYHYSIKDIFSGTNKQYIETSYVDIQSDELVIRILPEGDAAQELRLPFGVSLVQHGERERLITPSVLQMQRALNLSYTNMSKNGVVGGFVERTFINAQVPAVVTYENGRKVSRPGDLKVGPGKANFIEGVRYLDANNNTVLATPDLIYRDPVSPETFIQAAAHQKMVILQECQQLHKVLSGASSVSAVSRVEARADFHNSLTLTKTAFDTAWSATLQSALALAQYLSGDGGDVPDIHTDCKINTGPISADEKRIILDWIQLGKLSLETGLSMIGIDDPQAEIEKLKSEKPDGVSVAEMLVNLQNQQQVDTQQDNTEDDN